MPEHGPASQPDVLRDISQRIADAEAEVRRLRTARWPNVWHRGDHTVLPANPEGFTIVDIADESVWYVSNAEWRKLCPCAECAFPLGEPRIVGTFEGGGFDLPENPNTGDDNNHTETLTLDDDVAAGEHLVCYDVTVARRTSGTFNGSYVVEPVQEMISASLPSYTVGYVNSNLSSTQNRGQVIGTNDRVVGRTLGAHAIAGFNSGDTLTIKWRTPPGQADGGDEHVDYTFVAIIAIPGAILMNGDCAVDDDPATGFDDDIVGSDQKTGLLADGVAPSISVDGEFRYWTRTDGCSQTGVLLTAYTARSADSGDLTPDVGETLINTVDLPLAFTWKDHRADLPDDGTLTVTAGGTWGVSAAENSALACLYFGCK